MKEIITDVEKLREAAKPVKLVDDKGNVNKAAVDEIINSLKEVLETTPNLLALSAPQIGVDARIIGIKFNDSIRFFVNPVITKKLKYTVQGETFASMPGKEILVARPDEISVVYYTAELKYEDNKLLGAAARLFDQQAQLLDGAIPSDLGLVSDIEEDGSLAELTEEEFKQVIEIYKQFVKSKVATLEKNINEDAELAKQYRQFKFTESVITGHAALVGADKETSDAYKKAQAGAAISLKKNDDIQKQVNRAQLNTFLKHKSKGKRRK